jgi:hypothetical protein
MCNAPGTKRCYSTREAADAAAARHEISQTAQFHARVYWCFLCDAFHITKQGLRGRVKR